MNKRFRRIRRNRIRKENRRLEKTVVVLKQITLILMVCIVAYVGIDIANEQSIKKKQSSDNEGINNYVISRTGIENDEEIVVGDNEENIDVEIERAKQEVVPMYLGYDVIAKLEIPKISLETEVLSEFSEEALEQCVTKFYGPEPNTNGNFVIIGHNYQNTKMFKRLKELTNGDRVFLSDNQNSKNEYIVYDIYRVDYTNVECLAQTNINEVTLITCVNYTNDRLIVKARKI